VLRQGHLLNAYLTAAPPSRAGVVRVAGIGELDVEIVAAAQAAHALHIASAPVPARLLHGRTATLERPPAPPVVGVLVAVRTVHGTIDGDRLDFVEQLVVATAAPAEPPRDTAAVPALGPTTPTGVTWTPGPDADAQRRSWVRVPASVPFTLRAVIADREWGVGRTVDLSAGGALVDGIDAGLPGDRLRARIELPGLDEPVRAHVRVARVLGDGRRAMGVESIDARDRDRLAQFVAARQRELLRARGIWA
jgi:PilZ domain